MTLELINDGIYVKIICFVSWQLQARGAIWHKSFMNDHPQAKSKQRPAVQPTSTQARVDEPPSSISNQLVNHQLPHLRYSEYSSQHKRYTPPLLFCNLYQQHSSRCQISDSRPRDRTDRQNKMPRIATLKSTSEGSDDDRDGQEFYAGGANAGPQGGGSGLSVLGPSGGDGDAADPFSQMIARARGAAAEGAGGSSGEDVAGMVTITLYSDGFTVDEGPLRPLTDPENRAFIESVNSGFCPPELVKDGKPSNVRLKDNRKEKYTPPAAPAYVAFSGGGQTMGVAPTGPRIPASHSGKVTVNESEPTLRVQVSVVFV
jgi:hypothetical protein